MHRDSGPTNTLDSTRLTPHEKDEDENVNDKHARHDEGRTEPRGAKLRRHLQANSVTEIEKQVTQPHEIEQPDRGDREPPARSKRNERQPSENRYDHVPDGGVAGERARPTLPRDR